MLQHFKIRTKLYSALIPVCLVGFLGVTYVCLQYRNADETYSSFVRGENTATIDLARAHRNLAAVPYRAYQLVAYNPSDETFRATLDLYKSNRSALIKQLDDAGTNDPADSDYIIVLSKESQSILTQMDDVVKLAEANRDEEAKILLNSMDPRIADLGRRISKHLDQRAEEIKKRSANLSESAGSTVLFTLLGFGVAILMSLATATLVVFKGVTRPIELLRLRMLALANGRIEDEINFLDRKDEIGEMAQAVAVFRKNALEQLRLEHEADANRCLSEKERISQQEQKAREAADTEFAVSNLAEGLSRLSEGDLSYRISEPFADHLDVVRDNFNASSEKLQSALSRIAENGRGIDAGANEIRSSADDLAKRTEQQAASVEETAAALEEITTTVKDSTKRAQEAGQLIARARTGAEQSGNVVRKAVFAMEQIEKSSGEISNIISVIDEIAFQTNLLALNAGVEAARAGEAGKGFAVVAQEVRELAQRSASAAKDIKALITTSSAQVLEGVELVGETGHALATIVTEVQEINRNVMAIVESAQEQSSSLQQINTAVNQMDQDTQKNAAMVEESTAASHGLAREAASLNQLLGQFKLAGGFEAVTQSATPSERSVRSPARALGRKVAAAFNGNAAVRADWEEF